MGMLPVYWCCVHPYTLWLAVHIAVAVLPCPKMLTFAPVLAVSNMKGLSIPHTAQYSQYQTSDILSIAELSPYQTSKMRYQVLIVTTGKQALAFPSECSNVLSLIVL